MKQIQKNSAKFFLLLLIISGNVSAMEKISLLLEDRSLILDFQAQSKLLRKMPRHFLVIGNKKIPFTSSNALFYKGLLPIETVFVKEIDPQALEQFFLESGIPRKRIAEPVAIILDDMDNIIFSTNPQNGYEIYFDKLSLLINQALKTKHPYVRVPLQKIESKVIVDPRLANRGIKEIITIGESNFTNSSEARKQNILAAIKKFNKIIVPRGKVFSFNKILKSVEKEDGFIPELVIKGNETQKELGGGVCQVSTTVFRAAFWGGLPIVRRKNHSYAVEYYKPFGLDASIYLGGLDFQFRNDTPGDILVQAFVRNDNVYFIFYGTKDGRKMSFEGPIISEYTKAPKPIIIKSNELPQGDSYKVSNAHDGFKSEWRRTIIKKNRVQVQKFTSEYRPWPARIIEGTGNVDEIFEPKNIE